MTRVNAFRHEFVKSLPDKLQDGILYVSIDFATAGHKCCCGCGLEVVTPLSPTDWELIFDGKTVSLYPSVGNWSFPCQSHYWMDHGRVKWAAKWSKAQIEANRAHDRAVKGRYFGKDSMPKAAPMAAKAQPGGFRDFIRRWLGL